MKNKLFLSFKFLSLLALVFSLSGCLDAGLNRAARKQQEREEAEKANQPAEAEQIETAEVSLPNFNIREMLEQEIRQAQEEMQAQAEVGTGAEEGAEAEIETETPDSGQAEQPAEAEDQDQATAETDASSDNPALNSCDQLKPNQCAGEATTVCAEIQLTIGGSTTTEWLEFENACQACENQEQQLGNNTLKVLGYKTGTCE